MALLIEASDVLAVYETDRDATALQPFLEAADAFCEVLGGKGLPSASLKEVQRYVAAHLLYVTDAGVHETLRVGDVAERFTKSDRTPGLMDSRFGRMAVTFDTSGTLATLSHQQPLAEIELISPRC